MFQQRLDVLCHTRNDHRCLQLHTVHDSMQPLELANRNQSLRRELQEVRQLHRPLAFLVTPNRTTLNLFQLGIRLYASQTKILAD